MSLSETNDLAMEGLDCAVCYKGGTLNYEALGRKKTLTRGLICKTLRRFNTKTFCTLKIENQHTQENIQIHIFMQVAGYIWQCLWICACVHELYTAPINMCFTSLCAACVSLIHVWDKCREQNFPLPDQKAYGGTQLWQVSLSRNTDTKNHLQPQLLK